MIGPLSRYIPLVPRRSCILSWVSFAPCLYTTKPHSVWSPVSLNPLRFPPHESYPPAKTYLLSVCPPGSIRTLLTIFFVFFCVSSHNYTHPHPSAPIHTHSHPTVPLIVPPCTPLSHLCNPSLSKPLLTPCMSSRDHPCLPMSSLYVQSCPYTPLHPSSPNHTHLWPSLCVSSPIHYTQSTTLYFIRFDSV